MSGPVPPSMFDQLSGAIAEGRPAALATVVAATTPLAIGAKLLLVEHAEGTRLQGSLGDPGLDAVVTRDLAGELAAGRSGVRHYGVHGEAGLADVTVFVDTYAPPPRMLIFGAVDFTAALVRVAQALGYRVTVCDARESFATRARFPTAEEVVVDWPHRLVERCGATLGPADAICVLTHDHKFDVPAIRAALATPVGYVGAMGSRRTAAERRRLLVEAGVDDRSLARLMAPIGLDIGARTPEETAVSICAEIIAVRTGRNPASLRDTSGPLHDPPSPIAQPPSVQEDRS